MLHCIYMEELS